MSPAMSEADFRLEERSSRTLVLHWKLSRSAVFQEGSIAQHNHGLDILLSLRIPESASDIAV